jgi:hypothetical protein
MSGPSDREAFRSLLADLLAIKTAEELGEVQLPAPDRLAKYREVALPRADDVIRNYERTTMVEEVRREIITQLRDDLAPRVRAARLIEIGINVSALIIGALIGLSQFIFDPATNARQITAVYYALIIVVALQFVGNLVLRYFGDKR